MRKNLLLMFIGVVSFSFGQEVKDTSSTNTSNLPTISLSTDEIDNDEGNEAPIISGLLQSSKDPYSTVAGMSWGGAARFRLRGYDSENNWLTMNGLSMNDPENGWVTWNQWGGLNDMMRQKTSSLGLHSNDFSFGGIGGEENISTRASEYRKNVGVSYSITNRSYRNRVMLSYATGMMDNGWAIAAQVSRRWAQEGYVEGTFYDAYAYFLSVEKRLNKKHTLGFTALGAPTKRGKSAPSTQEAYDLLDNNYYNPNWGYQNGEKRNAKVGDTHRPLMMLAHYFTPTEKTTVTTSLGYSFGHNNGTSLDWYNARDPRPDYYRYLPSYYDDASAADAVATEFKENHQLDWNYFYQVNKNSEDGRAIFIVQNQHADYQEYKANITLNQKLNESSKIDAGLTYNYNVIRHYLTVDDLLGADHYLDIDKYAELDFPDDLIMIDNDVNNPDKLRYAGDKIGYDYAFNRHYSNAWLQYSKQFTKVDVFASANVSHTAFWRTGYMKNGKFQDNSYGDSKTQTYINYGIKGGLTYKINGRHYVEALGYYGTRAPYIQDAYISPRTRDFMVDGLKEETIMSGEASYHIRSPRLKARLTGYYTKFMDQTKVYSFYHDELATYVNQVLTGIDAQNAGMEFGAEGKISNSFTATSAVALGHHIYTSRATGVTYADNDNSTKQRSFEVAQKNFYQPVGPQNAYSLGVKYANPHYWFVTLTANYYQKNFTEFNPARRTTAAVSNVTGTDHVEPGSELWHQILDQEQLPDAFVLDVFFRKTLKVKDYFFYLNAGVNNILNNTDFVNTGFEQRRFDYENRDVEKFQSKYFYSSGINYFVSIGMWL